MINAESKEAREKASYWIDEAASQLAVLRAVLNDYDRLRDRAEVAELENERLRGLSYEVEQLRNRVEGSERECERLRDEVNRLRAETERHQRERQEIAETLARTLNDALLRLRGEPA